MTSAADLLPGSAGPYERAAAGATHDVLPIPLAELVDPTRTTAAFLPFVAVHNGVTLWFDDWSLARKRQIAADWQLPDLIGTRPGLVRYLAYVDAELISAVAHPRRFVAGRSSAGRQPINFPIFTARYLIKVRLRRHRRALVAGRGFAGRTVVKRVDLEPIRRARIAATVSKGPATQYTATCAHRRRPTFDEMVFGQPFDAFIDRLSL